MKCYACLFGLVWSSLVFLTTSATAERFTKSFDDDWRFFRGKASGAEQPDFQDANWRSLRVPHDWSIEGPYNETNSTGRGGGYLPSGVSWYRKQFTLPADDLQRHVFVDFDGVMANSEVWINGFHLGKRPYGYIGFRYELTGHLRFGPGKTNLIAVCTDTTVQPASRWYTGQGIYRHVRLVVTNPVHIEHWGTFVTTPQVSSDRAVVRIQNTVVNQSDTSQSVFVQSTIQNPQGGRILKAATQPQFIAAGQSVDFQQEIPLPRPQLWSLDHPNVYRVITEIRAGKATLDSDVTPFGIRQCEFKADTGFWLNGVNLKIKGACLHHDGGAFGAAVPLSVWKRRIEHLRRVGINAIRTAHNPPAPEFLDLCDRMGFLVMDETLDAWTVGKPHAENGYNLWFKQCWEADTGDAIRRDRNHPSIILYSAGNEIHDIPNAELAFQLFVPMRDLIHRLDPSRPVTLAVFRPDRSHVYENGFSELMDVVGQNYREEELIAAHNARPERKVIGTENHHDGPTWLAMRDHPFYSGQFLWSGVDYLGESDWPNVVSGSGLLDHTGMPKPMAFERKSWWSDQPMVYLTRRIAPRAASPSDPGYGPVQRYPQVLFSDWTPANQTAHVENVEVYSNCQEVELLLNGKSLGSKPLPADASPRTWMVPFEPGTLRAVGRNKGRVVAGHELRTAGKPAKILLAVDRKQLPVDWDDVAFVAATIVDKDGVIVPNADDLITFKLSGPGTIAAVDNGSRISHDPFQATQRHAFQGQCLAMVKGTAASGRVTVTASATGLMSSTINIKTVLASAKE